MTQRSRAAAGLRDATDLDDLADGLTGVMRERVRPARVSLWPARAREGED